MNFHDELLRGMLGLREYPESLIPRIMVFTSRPLLAVRPNVRTMDVGWNGEYLPAMQGTPDL